MHPSSLPHTLGDKLSVLYKEKEKMYRSWRSKKDRAASCAVSSGERVKRPVLRFHIVEETTRIVLFGTFDRHTSVSLYIILHQLHECYFCIHSIVVVSTCVQCPVQHRLQLWDVLVPPTTWEQLEYQRAVPPLIISRCQVTISKYLSASLILRLQKGSLIYQICASLIYIGNSQATLCTASITIYYIARRHTAIYVYEMVICPQSTL